jgi:glycosyltransferase involved in cell wall biosynthesis
MAVSFKIVFFNRSFYPDTTATGQLLTELCESLVKDYGCKVSVICGRPLNAHGVKVPFKGIEILRVTNTNFSHKSFLGRILNYISYFFLSIFASFKLKDCDLVVTLTDPPIIVLVGLLVSRRLHIPFIISVKDIFPEAARGLKGSQNKIINFILDRINRFCFKRAHHIVSIGELMRKKILEKKGIGRDRVSVIPEWADCSEIFPVAKRNPFSIEHNLSDYFVVMYSGNLGASSGMETLLESLKFFKDYKDIIFVLIGEGLMKDSLIKTAKDSGLENIKFLPYQPKSAMLYSFSSADIFVVLLKKGLAGYSVPSKIYGILASGRPYVASIEEESELAGITREFECGVLASPQDPLDLKEKILYFYNNRGLMHKMGENARKAALTFDRKIGVESYYRLFEKLTNDKKDF